MLIFSQRNKSLVAKGLGYFPVLALCRALVGAGYDPGRPLHVYRGKTLALTVRSIGEGARLRVSGSGTGFIWDREGNGD